MSLNNHVTQTAVDFKGLAELRRSATVDKNDQDTLKQVAGQFESLFVNMMLKSMRQASLGEGIFDSKQSDTYRDMSDQQLAIDISAKGSLGLRDVIFRQLGGKPEQGNTPNIDTMNSPPVRTTLLPMTLEKVMQSAPQQQVDATKELTFNSPKEFVQTLWPMAKKAGDRIGVTPDVILAQAALETGWGKHVINKANDLSSHNLFNIKADPSWQGGSAVKGTLEYRQGVAVKEQAKFRSYDSYQESFNDYVDFLQTQPRYQDALKDAGSSDKFIEGLQKAGYATDPAYAEKIKKILNSSMLAHISL